MHMHYISASESSNESKHIQSVTPLEVDVLVALTLLEQGLAQFVEQSA